VFLSFILHFVGSAFMLSKAIKYVPDAYDRLVTQQSQPWMFGLCVALWVVAASANCIFFWYNTRKMLRDFFKFQDELLWWHFLPPGNVTIIILLCIGVVETCKAILGTPTWNFFVFGALDWMIAPALLLGGSIVLADYLSGASGEPPLAIQDPASNPTGQLLKS
jgi:hypothetical protein